MSITFQGAARERLDKVLHSHYPDLSRHQIQQYIKTDNVTVNGQKVAVHHWLKSGDIIELSHDKPMIALAEEIVVKDLPEVIYRDEDIAVVNKPAGLLVHPTDKHEQYTLTGWAQKEFSGLVGVGDTTRPGLVHRLDKDVGGLVLLALNQTSFEFYKGLFAEHKIVKRYYALVNGLVQPDDGKIGTPIERQKKSGRMVAQSGTGQGKEALTLFKVLQRFHHYTLIEVQIITGRTHQIRTHFFSIGHSIVGDQLYQTRDIKKQKSRASSLSQPFLFAFSLEFDDRQGRHQHFTLDLPDRLKEFLGTLV